ncbi:helix-turn-helix transcriptional regulator [Agromyces sp. MMS24-K17]|uniref:helix-turn-helix transcriptional regulator n=1 Tax=Agromyces sp. MMS24-K17 TaxID=3372850 RepID=UPI003754F6F3
MPISSSPSTSRRLLALLSLLQSRRDWPAHVLAERLEVSERTIRRDVERLRELDYAIDATRGPDGGYRLGAGTRLPPLLFDDDQAVAIALALRTAASLGAGIEDDAQRALATLRSLLPDRLACRIEPLAVAAAAARRSGEPQADPTVLVAIGEAIRTRRELRFDYAAPARGGAPDDDGTTVRHVEPHHLLLRGGRWYLLGFSADRDDWRTYRVDRITPRTHTGRAFTPRPVPGDDPARYLAARFKGSDGGDDTWPCWGTATLHAPIQAVAPFVDDGTAEALAPDRTRVTLGAWSWGALAAAFARFEADLDDVEPAGLRAAFGELAGRAARVIRSPREADG